MTYSRPGTSQVNALPSIQAPRSTGVIGSPGVGANPTGRFVNLTNPSVAGANAGRQEALISNFLQQSLGPIKTIGTAMAQASAKKELGQLLDSTPNIGQQYRQGSPDAQAQIRSLGWMAQDMFYEGQVKSGLAEYQTSLAAEALSDSRLTQAGEWGDEQSQAWAEIQGRNFERSFKGLPASFLGEASVQVGALDGAVKGQIQKARATDQANTQAIGISNGMGATLELDAGKLSQLRAEGADSDDLVAAVEGSSDGLAAQIRQNSEKGVATPQQQMTMLLSGAQQKIAELILDERFEDADEVLDLLELLSKKPIMTGPDGKVNFWDLKAPGKEKGTQRSFAGWLGSVRSTLDKQFVEWQKKKAIKDALPLIKQAAAGDQLAMEQIRTQVIPTLDSVEALQAVTEATSSADSFGQAESPQQLKAAGEFEIELNNPNRDVAATNAKIQAAMADRRIGLRTGLSLLNRNATPSSGSTTGGNAFTALSEADNLNLPSMAAEDILRAGGADLTSENIQEETNELRLKAFDNTVKRLNAMVEAGEKLPDRPGTLKIFREELDSIKDTRLKEAGQKQQNQTFEQKTTTQLNEWRQNLLSGKTGAAAFPQSLVEELKIRNPNAVVTGSAGRRNLERYLKEKIKQSRTDDGRPMFPNPDGVLRDTIRDVNRELKKPMPVRAPAAGATGGNRTGNFTGGGVPEAEKTQGDGEQASVVDDIKKTLVAVAGGLIDVATGGQPATATELEYPEGLGEMARLWSTGEPPSLKTQNLPQVPAETPVKPVSIAINTPNHPYFVAIGIAEGTRNPNGGFTEAYFGHTDSGDGNLNRGTVSGGRFGGSPQQVDRRWMGQLTKTSISATPLLQQLGLQPGTQGWNRVMFNVLDLRVQAPAALDGFFQRLQKVGSQGWSVEAIAKARADAFYNPQTGQLEASGFGNNYSRLFADQRSRAGVWDYRRRL